MGAGRAVGKLRENWRLFKESEPGRRFQDRYYRRQREGNGGLNPRKVLNIAIGGLLILAGAFMVLAPGPGWVTFFVGFWMIGGESRPAARFLDRIEVALRKLARWARDAWTRSPVAVKVLICALILLCAAAVGYGIYYFLF